MINVKDLYRVRLHCINHDIRKGASDSSLVPLLYPGLPWYGDIFSATTRL
jgi:hypothetical protein